MARHETVLGEFIRQQRELQDLSVRAFAQMAGISNPYLSQIERGLRAPSDQVLDAIASSLHMSADALRREAGVPEEPANGADGSAVVDAIRADKRLTPTQRRSLLEIYRSFVG
jgi:transcriptional regulator with XRE-family HTH domain